VMPIVLFWSPPIQWCARYSINEFLKALIFELKSHLRSIPKRRSSIDNVTQCEFWLSYRIARLRDVKANMRCYFVRAMWLMIRGMFSESLHVMESAFNSSASDLFQALNLLRFVVLKRARK
jgi:hypothetical protein